MDLTGLLHSRNRIAIVRSGTVGYALLLIALLGLASGALAATASSVTPAGSGTARTAATKSLLRLPLRFEGMADGQAMTAHLGDHQLRLGKAGAIESRSATGQVLTITLEGANRNSTPAGQAKLPGRSNYFFGRDPSRWRKGVEQFSQARVEDVYDGIDLLYYGNGSELEHDYILAPGSDASQIRMRIGGGTSRIDGSTGDLVVSDGDAKQESLRLVRPVAYQSQANGLRKPVVIQYTQNENGSFGFILGEYDRALPLTIDPVLTYSTYFGGSNSDSVNDVKTDAAGNIYLLLQAESTDLPVVSQIPNACHGACGPSNPSGTAAYTKSFDFYLAKLDPTGQTLLYSTYIGGSDQDLPASFVIATDGTIYIAGETLSSDFPTVNAYSSNLTGQSVGSSPLPTTTLTRLSADGSTILYSSFIGGGFVGFDLIEGTDGYLGGQPDSVAAGPDGVAYLLGFAQTTSYSDQTFPDIKNSDYTLGGGSFVAKFDTTKSGADSLVYAKTFGQPGDRAGDTLAGIAIDSKQNIWIFGRGYKNSDVTPDAIQPICGGGAQCNNTHLRALDPTGALLYATFLGGTMNAGGGPGIESAQSIFIDPLDNIYLAGSTESTDFPLKNAAYTDPNAASFLTKLSPGGKSILYSTYEYVSPALVTANAAGLAGLAAEGTSGLPQINPLPSSAGALNYSAAFEVFDTTKSGSDSVIISSYLGGTGGSKAEGLAFDPQGDLLFAGQTGDPMLPLVDAYQSTCTNCGYPGYTLKGFAARVQLASGSLILTPATQSFPDTQTGTSSPAQTSKLTNTTSATISLSAGTFTDSTDFSASDDCNSTIASGASCTFTFTFTPQSATALTSTYSIYDVSNPTSPLNVALSGTGTAPPTPKASLSPSSADFGSVATGSTSSARTFTLTNAGSAALPITLITVTGSNASSFVTGANTCGTSLAAGGSCTIALTFSPAVAGSASAMLSIADSVGTQTAALTGTSFAAAPKAMVTPASVDFGPLALGSVLNPQTITLTNTGNAALPFTSFAITGTNASSFQVRNGACPKSLAAGATCSIDVIFTPSTAGTAVAALSFTDSLGTQSATLTGEAVYASATLVPAPGSPNNFGNVTVGGQVASAIRLNNNSQSPITVTGGTITGTGFKLDSSGSCAAPVPPRSLCEVSVFFDPTTIGPASVTLSIATDIAGVLTLPFTGTGVPPTATLTPATYGFGSVQLGTSSGLITFLLTNTSPVPIKLIDSTVTGSGFRLESKAGTLAPGTSAKYLVAFEPTAIGPATGTLSVISDAGTATSTLTGTGVAPLATLTPTTADFGNVTVGAVSSNHAFTLTNAGSAPLSIASVGITGPSAASFLLDENQCVTSLPAGGSCLLGVTLLPTGVGQAVATLSVVDSVGTQGATLTAQGILPTLTITSPSIDFGAVTVGTTVSKTLTYTNTSPVSILFNSQSETGDLNGAIKEAAGGTCTAASTGVDLRAGGSCTFTFTFTPTAASNSSGTLSYFDTAGTQTISFTGHGVLPTLTVTPTTLAYGNVPVGTTANQTVTFTNSSTIPITFAGNAAPSGDFGTVFMPNLTNTCAGNAIAAGASCTIGFSFTPAALASYSGSLSFTDNAGTQTITFSGTGVYDGPRLVLSPTTYTFGAVPAGSNPTETVTLTNAGSEEANFSYGDSVVLNGLQVAVTGNSCQTTLAAGASCTIPVQLTGADTGSAQITIDIAGNTGTNSVAASLIGFGAAGGPTPTFIDLGNGFSTGALTFNGAAATASGVLQLTGDQASQVSSAFYSTPVSATTFSTDFAFQLLNPLAEGLTFTIQANAPNAIGTGGGGLGYQGIAKSIALKLDLRDTAGEGDNSTGIYVNGAAPTVPATTLAGSGIDLHSGHVFTLHLDYDGTTESIILTDTATGAVWKTQAAEDIPTLIGSDTAYFGFTASTEAAAPAPDTDIATTKPSAHPLAAASTASTTTSVLDWTYTTAPAPATLTPASLDFGNRVVGGLSVTQLGTLTNTGVAAIQVASVTASDPQITLTGSNCIGTPLTPGQTCTVGAFFAPTAVGPFSGTIAVKYFLGDGSKANENFTASLKVTGNGIPLSLVRVSPDAADFGTIPLNQTSSPQTLTIINDGGAATTLSGITTTGAFQIASGATCVNGMSLASLKSCTVPVVFAPVSSGAASGTLSVSYTDTDDPGKTQTATSTVTGIGIPSLLISPASLDFEVPLGVNLATFAVTATPVPQTVTLTNTANFPITFSSPRNQTGDFGTIFALTQAGTCNVGTAIAPGASCTLVFSYMPLASNQNPNYKNSGTLTLFDSQTLAFTGNGYFPSLTIDQTNLDYGNVIVGSRPSKTVTLTNNSPVTVPFPSFKDVTAPFLLIPGETCFAVPNLNHMYPGLLPGASCTLVYQFTPTAAVDYSTTLYLTNLAQSQIGQPTSQAIHFTGDGVVLRTVSPTSLDFGDVMVDTVGTRAVTISNDSNVPIVTGIGAVTPTSGDFGSIFAATNKGTCSTTVAPGASCTLVISFIPKASTNYSGTFSVLVSAGTQTITVTGHGIPLVLSFSPSTLDFGNLPLVPGSVVEMIATLTNTSLAPIQDDALQTPDTTQTVPPGGQIGLFSDPGTCLDNVVGGDANSRRVIPPGGSCTVKVLVIMGSPGTYSGAFTLVTTDGTRVPLTYVANVTTPARGISPTALDFGPVPVGSTATRTIAITNTSDEPIPYYFTFGQDITQGGDQNLPDFFAFSEAAGSCNLHTTLAPGGSCTLAFTFTPTSVATESGTISLLNSPAPTNVTLTGQGVSPTAPDFTLLTLNTNLTVIRGSSAKLVIDLGPSTSGPFTAPVTFTASGLPDGATATFSPSTLVPGSGTSTTMTVSVPALAAHNKLISPFPPGGRTAVFGISAAALIAGLFGFRRKLNPRLLLCLCALSLIGAIAGCGSGAGFAIPTTSSNFVVTATSGSITHTISVTLTVQ